MSEDELLEILVAFMPDSVEGWLALILGCAAMLSLVLPAPSASAHPALRACHRLLCLLGLGAGKLRASGRLAKIGRLSRLIRRKPQ